MSVVDYFVEVRRVGTDKIVRSLGPMSEKKAETVEAGLDRQLNHEAFYTQIVSREIGDETDDGDLAEDS